MPERSIYIIDCIWELFVLVGATTRGDRINIKAALSAAKVRRFSNEMGALSPSRFFSAVFGNIRLFTTICASCPCPRASFLIAPGSSSELAGIR